MTPNHNETTEHQPAPEPEKQDTIFLDVADMSGYDKNLKTARVYLYIIAGLQIAVGIYEYATVEEYLKLWVLGIDAGIGVVFLALAILSYKKPVLSFGLALALFIILHVGIMFLDPSNIYKGIILKILVIVALVKGFKDAREYEEMKRTLLNPEVAV